MRFTHASFLFCCCIIVQFIIFSNAQDDESVAQEKRAMRNALVRFGRSGMRNALVRFGKRMPDKDFSESEYKRGNAPHPFVRFGRSGRLNHIKDILSTMQRLKWDEDYLP